MVWGCDNRRAAGFGVYERGLCGPLTRRITPLLCCKLIGYERKTGCLCRGQNGRGSEWGGGGRARLALWETFFWPEINSI